jgi:hypothetical protein
MTTSGDIEITADQIGEAFSYLLRVDLREIFAMPQTECDHALAKVTVAAIKIRVGLLCLGAKVDDIFERVPAAMKDLTPPIFELAPSGNHPAPGKRLWQFVAEMRLLRHLQPMARLREWLFRCPN